MKKTLTILTICCTVIFITLYNARNIYASKAFHSIVQNSAITNSTHKPLSSESTKMLSLFGDVYEKIKEEYVRDVTDAELVETALNGMLSSLDPHSSYLDEKAYNDMQQHTKGEFGGIGMEVTMEHGFVKVISPIDDGPAIDAGIKPGDYITSVNDEPVQGLSLIEAVDKITGKPGTKVKITIARENEPKLINVTVERKIIKLHPIKHQMLDDGLLYIRVANFSENTGDELRKAIQNTLKTSKISGTILDLRRNPGGLLDQAIEVAGAFLQNVVVVSTKGRNGKNETIHKADSQADLIAGAPMIVLIDNGSASASEIVAAALQDHKRAILMGSKTFGKGSVQVLTPVKNGGAIKMTTSLYYTPNGKSIQAEGVAPDIDVRNAKIEFLDGGRVVNEATLVKHIANVSVAENKKKSVNSEPINGKKQDDTPRIYREDDYMLSRAIELIRSIMILRPNDAKYQ